MMNMNAKIIRKLIGTTLVLTAAIFSAPESHAQHMEFKEISNILSKTDYARGEFTLTKVNGKTGRSMKSSGNYTLSKADGMIWFTKKPVESVMAVSKTAMVQEVRGKRTRIDASENKTFMQIADMTAAVFRGDYDGISKSFNIEYTADDENWKAVLLPKDGTVAAAIEKVIIAGSYGNSEMQAGLHIFEITQADGSKSNYELKNQVAIDKLTADEKAFFE